MVKDLIDRTGHAYGASEAQKDRAYKIIKCEDLTLDPLIQSGYLRPDGSQEQSFGLGQFNLPAKNLTVDGQVFTKELAQDPVVSVATVVKYITEGKASLWTCNNYVN